MRRMLWLMTVFCAVSAPGIAEASGRAAETEARAATASRAPEIVQRTDGRTARLVARYRGLIVSKAVSRDRTTHIELTYGGDVVNVTLQLGAPVSVTRDGRTIAITSPQSLEAVQHLLAGSDGVFATRLLLSERENVSDLHAPEISLLSSAAFIASLLGDVDAPRRLASRFVEKYRGIFRQVRLGEEAGCWQTYSDQVTRAWDGLTQCMDEANEDTSMFRGAFRRVACNVVWAVESEAAWFEFMKCLNPRVD